MSSNIYPFRDLNEDAVVRNILEGTATETGERFFEALVENLSKALNTHSAWVTEIIKKSSQLRALDVAGKNVTCDEIGGDYFDFLWGGGVPQ